MLLAQRLGRVIAAVRLLDGDILAKRHCL